MTPKLKILIMSSAVWLAGLAIFGWSVIPIDPGTKPIIGVAVGYAFAMAIKEDVKEFFFGTIAAIIIGFVGYLK